MEVREANAAYLAQTGACPPGYKQTEVGVIPEDWEVKPIGDLQPFVTSGSRGWAAFYSEHGAPFIRITNLIRTSIYLDLDDLRFVGLSADNCEGVRTQLQDGDVLISITADIGIVGYVSEAVPKPAYINQHIAIVRFDPTKTNPKFISYFLASEKPQRLFRALTDSGAKAGMNLTTVKQVCLALPLAKTEQDAIAGALSDADALIESLEQLIAKKHQLKQGAMQELLTGKKRLPGFSGEWEVKRLGELADIRSGGTPSTTQPQFWDGDILWCTPTDITSLNGFKYLHDTSRKISHQGLKNSSAEMIPANSIVMTSRATIGECAINTVLVSTNQGFKNFIPFEHFDVEFLYYLLLTQKQGFISLCGGSTFLEIGKTQLVVFEVKLPAEKAEQTAIAAILSDLDAELAALESKLAKARRIKQGMMQELLTGRIRLVQPAVRIIPLPTQKQASPAAAKSHNWQINEAVIIGVLAKNFGSEKFPLARKRCTKLTYLLHRHVERQAEGYLKKAAGPYNPAVKYKGPEGIAQKNGYVRQHHNGTYPGFVAADKITEAEAYFAQWYGPETLAWLEEQFRYRKTDELELLTTVDMAMEDLRREGEAVGLDTVKQVIRDHPEWEAKLEREIFADPNIIRAMAECREFLGD